MGQCFGALFASPPNPDPSSSRNGPCSESRFSNMTSTTNGLSAAETTTTTTVMTSTTMTSQISEECSYDGGRVLNNPNLREFSFSEMRSATKNFSAGSVLGEGGFGKVYKGWVDERTLAPSRAGTGIMVAIKKLNSESVQGFQEWQAEVNFLGWLSHPNLVKLLGYCWEDEELLLVYEFMQKGSLENHLFRRNPNVEPLSWERRLQIAIGVARGLAFLHSSQKKVIYRDFKASNILLDGSYNAKLSDFGLAKLGPAGGESHVTTRIMGTYGYAAPEYMATGHLYVKSDVYGFGVVLLEMLTGRRALDTRRPSGQQNLVEWAKPCLSSKRKLSTVMDPRMDRQYTPKASMQAAQLSLKCLEAEPKNRPSMIDVVEALEGIEAMAHNRNHSNSSSSRSHSNSHGARR